MDRELSVALVITTIFVLILFAPSIYGFLSSVLTLRGTGDIRTIGVAAYWDSNCTKEVTTIDWGLIEPGSSKSVTIYLKNEGNTPITLSLNTTDWSPSNASDYLSLSWDYLGDEIKGGEVIRVSMTLTVSPNISGITSFSFNIIITAREVI